MTKLERKAAMIVAAATAGVIVSGVKLIKKHTRYLAEKAAATFGTDDGEDLDNSVAEEALEESAEETLEESAAEAPEETAREDVQTAEEEAPEESAEVSEEKD